MQKSTVTLRLPDDLIEQLRQHAGLTGGYGRISEIAEQAIRAALDRESTTIPQAVLDAARRFGDRLDELVADRIGVTGSGMLDFDRFDADIATVKAELGDHAHAAWEALRWLDECRRMG